MRNIINPAKHLLTTYQPLDDIDGRRTNPVMCLGFAQMFQSGIYALM